MIREESSERWKNVEERKVKNVREAPEPEQEFPSRKVKRMSGPQASLSTC